ncbi:hypothetical protein BOTBODRAFT_172615 [Botryobasidium botryosum FD-172 SS1]|uniref:Tetrapyrrole biosynthesis uroporphyrinogen III synthase domain-containing protein n=1 Tax=Botryobasidium botryosum (strain FD-172 SS1) TaxID=930990 RepID=A0A067MN83_BOTB1|nr:hypothetical protein BOTBODRAFT_172615 [Botryobasidium botryosum FD-172 SS1]
MSHSDHIYPSTDKSLHKVANNLPPLSHFSPSLILGSAEAGTGENLARYILTDYGTRWSAAGITRGTGKLPLLYLVGDKTTDVVPRVLKEGGFETLYLQVCSTFPSDRLREDIEVAVESLRSDDDGSAPHTWIVFFATSAAKSALPILRRHFALPSTVAQPETSSENAPDTANALPGSVLPARFATIGPTTATFLRDEHPSRFRVDVISPRPDAASLANAIREFDAAHAASL